MNHEQLSALLSSVTGHLYSNEETAEQDLNDLQQAAANALLQQHPSTITNQQFSFSTSDLFSREKIDLSKQAKIEELAKTAVAASSEAGNLKMFVRDVPVRTTQIAGSVPDWAAGALLERSIGPFLTAEGLWRWFDFYRVEKLIAIYNDGQGLPSILFKTSLRRGIIDIITDHPVELQKHYTVLEGSVWIRASLLSASAPADKYCGFKVKGGDINLDVAPVMQGNKLVIKNNNNVRVALNLVQQKPTGTAGSGQQGIDARNAEYHLPSSFLFSFKGTAKNIEQIAEARWNVYGNETSFRYAGDQNVLYNPFITKVLIPFATEPKDFEIKKCESPFLSLTGKAAILQSYWGLAAATLDVSNPLAADGSGSLMIVCDKGLSSGWKTLDGNDVALAAPLVFGEPGRIAITDLLANGSGATQHIDLWKDDQNPHGTSVDLSFVAAGSYMYNTYASGDEALATVCNARVNTDRPMKVNGEPVTVRSKESLVIFAVNASQNIFYLLDDNLIWDNKLPFEKVPSIKPISLALENALFTTSPPNGCFLFGYCNDDFTKMNKGSLLLTFGVFSYLPTLPDPYLASLGVLRRQFSRLDAAGLSSNASSMWLWLTCLVTFKPLSEEKDEVNVSFHLGLPPAQNTQIQQDSSDTFSATPNERFTATDLLRHDESEHEDLAAADKKESFRATSEMQFSAFVASNIPPNYDQQWNDRFGAFNNDMFALLDVSSNANQLGVSFGVFGTRRLAMMQTAMAVDAEQDNEFPLQVQQMQVVSKGVNVRAFLLPLIAWEPVFNLTPAVQPMDPPFLWNYYPDDGGATRIFNNSSSYVPLAPIPLVDFIIGEYKNDPKNQTAASFTLPFGIKALAALSGNGTETTKPVIDNKRSTFNNDLVAGIQIQAWAGNYDVKPAEEKAKKDSNMFPGYVIQLNNIIGLNGNPTYASTLGDSVTRIFNGEFFTSPLTYSKPKDGRGVPVTRIDFSGYGASMFSNWLSPSAEFAATSQARFDVMMGRTAHEVIQVKSILYPWGIRVVRTITLFRVSSGYVYRVDSGWKAESDGKFDFRYKYIKIGTPPPPPGEPYASVEVNPYQIHPGVIKGLFNVQNIKEDKNVSDFQSSVTVPNGGTYINGITGEETINTGAAFVEQVLCRPVWFDCDVEIENLVMGHNNGRTPSKKVLGYVQLAPTGKPLTDVQFRDLLNMQFGSIGGPIASTIDVNKSGQQMRLNRFDINTSVDASNNLAFVAAARGNVFLPKDGSWSMVQHNVGTGEVTPLAESVTVPLIRKGKWIKDQVIDPAAVANSLVEITNPIDLLRAVNNETVNFGFLQSTATQKALFLTPSYKQGVQMLLSKAPPVFADAYRLMSGNGIFPNIGNAINNFGKAMPLLNANGVAAFTETIMGDGTKVLELLKVEAEKKGAEVIKQGMDLLQKGANGLVNKALQFDVPSFEVPLVEMDGLKIYIDYKTKKEKTAANLVDSKLNFDVSSFANTLEDQWKGRLNNLSMVVDLGSIKRLLIIKGNFESRKGKESGYEGDSSGFGGLPTPELEFNEKLQPLIDLLQMLADLSTGNYAEVLKRGMKIAMSNSGEIWQYKFEAAKTIPVLRFPPTDVLYNDPNCPLKLEAGLDVGMYFNAALKVTSDPKQLLPTAGAYLEFKGSLSVMCVSVSIGTIYAVGSVDVKIACDTQKGPSLLLKFGFGAQIVVGLPVVGNVSVLYMIGVEMYAGTDKVTLSGFMLFRGHAELLGGLVGVTITIEAKGTVERSGDETSCSASVTFALDISIFLIIDISFSETWSESRQIA